MFLKKSLVLVGTKSENQKAVLSLESKKDLYEGRLRLYNFLQEPEGILSIGFNSNGKISKAGLVRVSSGLYNFKIEKDQLGDDFSCAVINLFHGKSTPVLFSSSKNIDAVLTKLNETMVSSLEDKSKKEDIEKVLDEQKIDYDKEYKEEIEKEIDKNFCNDCSGCKYKKAFYERNQNRVFIEDEKQKNFFSQIKTQVDSLFEKSNHEEFLEEIIPNSKFVKVEYEESGDYYILGLIYEEDSLKYVVYGVPGVYQKNPPKEISGYPVWLPLDKDRNESFGYWLSYQDADTGESVKAVVE